MLLDYGYPGAVAFFFGGTRTYHRVAAGLEDAGWEIFDCIMYLYGSGFPKAHDLGEGHKTSLKPAYEPIVCARIPRKTTYKAQFEQHGTGGLNIDGCRIGIGTGEEKPDYTPNYANSVYGIGMGGGNWVNSNGRYPANLILDDEAGVLLDQQSGELKAGGDLSGDESARRNRIYGSDSRRHEWESYGDEGGASRFFYTAKAPKWEREAGLEDFQAQIVNDGRDTPIDNPYQRGETQRKNVHPTVKPIMLTEYLARLLLPPERGEVRRILISFSGVGSEMIGAHFAGWDEVVGIERESNYVELASARIHFWEQFKSYDQAKTRINAERQQELEAEKRADSVSQNLAPIQLSYL